MTKTLVIVESPTKERTIQKLLGKNFIVKSSFGHIRDLPKRTLGVDEKKDFEPTYEIIPKAKKIISQLKSAAEKAVKIYLATDFDREGEAIAWHLIETLCTDKTKFKRITFHEITPDAIKDSLKHPRDIDYDLIYAQQARRVLDRLVGYKLSPLLWKKIYRGLSAGRVQSVAVRFICDREAEIEQFKPVEYWTLDIDLKNNTDDIFTARLIEVAGKKIDKLDIAAQTQIDTYCNDLKTAYYTVANIESKERLRNPLPPFITSSMQQESSYRLGFSASRTMAIAQSLYEGVELAEGSVGLITYMRTDSLHVSTHSKHETADYIVKTLGSDYMPLKPRVFKTKVKGAQEAHEAIHPTSVWRTPKKMKSYLTDDQYKLYTIIWERFVASQMKEALYDTMAVDITAQGAARYGLRATGRVLKFPGFLKVYQSFEEEEETDKSLPLVKVHERLEAVNVKPEQHFTEPPPRYNEASFIRTLETHGIGRPSTYAPTINIIVERGYVRLEQKRFYPTDLGKLVNQSLKDYFPEIVDINFTAWVEDKLDIIAEGKREWQTVVLEFYVPFMAALQKAETDMKKVIREPIKTDKKCSVCGAAMIKRFSRYGHFLSCDNYPKCKNKIAINEKGEEEALLIDDVCHKCGSKLMIKMSRRGKFLACSAYPQCKTTYSIGKDGNKIIRPDPVLTDRLCEKCQRNMYLRIGKRGPFLACSGFPRCRNIKKVTPDIIEKYQHAIPPSLTT